MKFFSNVTRIVACLFVLLISNFFGFGARADDCLLGTAGCDPEFTMTTTSDTSSFSFRISAAGTYYLDCGNGEGVRTIDKTSTGAETITCSYANAGVHTIGLSGQATEYASAINPAAIDFKENTKLAGIGGSLGAIFGTLPNNEYKVPSFYYSFYKCTNLKGNIPAELFAGVNGQPREFMFYKTFYGCHQLTGSIPENLFAGIKGKPVQYLFGDTFSKIVDTSSTTYPLMGLTGEIPENLFAGISGAPAEAMFKRTFYGCAGLTGSIPEKLFAGLDGAPAKELFHTTFRGCSGLTGEIPENLFAGIKGAPAVGMFESTFASELASKHGNKALMKLSGAIPENLFGGISGAPADRMFYNTFYRCEKLTKIPAGLFAGIKGAPATDMMDWMFEWCTGLTEFVPPELFAGITSTNYTAGAMSGIFENSNMATSCPSGYAQFITGFESDWGTKNGKTAVSCINFEPEFTVTTTKLSAGATFEFQIAPQGTYYINWGDGKAQKIIKTDTVATTYSHKYTNAGTYTIGIMGQAEKYDTSVKNAAISFEGKTNIAGIGGSLGAIFGTLTNGNTPKQPTFYASFYKCSNLKGEIPADLFKGISGQPRDYMFYKLFRGCSGLTGEIPANLFADLKGEPRAYMFADTFAKLSGGTPMGFTGAIPEKLFAGISGKPADYMFYNTFYGCEKLTGEIPATMFAGIKGSPANKMMAYTFEECKGLDGFIPPELFANINSTDYQAGPMTDVFLNSGIDTVCPSGYTQFITGFESDWWITKDKTKAVSCILFEPEFTVTTTKLAADAEFSFNLSAKGTYYINWGDGNTEVIVKTNTTETTYPHKYATAGTYNIEFMGQATEYNTSNNVAAIQFGGEESNSCPYLAGIDGSLGAIFGTISDGDSVTQPLFRATFANCKNIDTSIPADLFNGVYGQPRPAMFYGTFQGCLKLSGSIPKNLFADLSGEFRDHLFRDVFMDCDSLTGEIPQNLFADVQGAPKTSVFEGVFHGCSGLTGEIPADLFKNVKGVPAQKMFEDTFSECTGLTGEIPGGLFANIRGAAAANMFTKTFANTNLSGEVPQELFAGIDPDSYSVGMMQNVFTGTNMTRECPANQYFPGSDFEEDWSGAVFCQDCAKGTTSPKGSKGADKCVGAVKLHVGENSAMQLSSVRPESSPVMVFDVDGKTYYGQLSDTEKPMNKDTHQKYRVLYNDQEYWLHDYTAE